MSIYPFVVAGWLLLVGLYGVASSRNLIHLIVCVQVVQASTYLLLLGVGYRDDATAPVFAEVPVGTRAVDPVVQALTLTDGVVSATVTALLLALAVQVHKRSHTLDPARLTELQG